MKHDIPIELRASYVHSLALSIATVTGWQEFENNSCDLEKIITVLENTYDDVKRIANIRR